MFQRLQLKKHALTAISYMLPIVVTAGLLIAIGNLTGGKVITDYQATYTVPDALVSLGVLGLSLIHISEPTRRTPISYAVFCLKKKKTISYAVFFFEKKKKRS